MFQPGQFSSRGTRLFCRQPVGFHFMLLISKSIILGDQEGNNNNIYLFISLYTYVTHSFRLCLFLSIFEMGLDAPVSRLLERRRSARARKGPNLDPSIHHNPSKSIKIIDFSSKSIEINQINQIHWGIHRNPLKSMQITHMWIKITSASARTNDTNKHICIILYHSV